MGIDHKNTNVNEEYAGKPYKSVVRAQIQEVNTEKGTVNLRLFEGGTRDNVPITFPIYGETIPDDADEGEFWGVCYMPVKGAWVWLVQIPNGPPLILPYQSFNWEKLQAKTRNQRPLKEGEIFIRSRMGAQIDMDEDGNITIEDDSLSKIEFDSDREKIKIETNKGLEGTVGDVDFAFGNRSPNSEENSLLPVGPGGLPLPPNPLDITRNWFSFVVKKTLVPGLEPQPWVKVQGGSLPSLVPTVPGSTDVLELKVLEPTSGAELGVISFTDGGDIEMKSIVDPLTGVALGSMKLAKDGNITLSPSLKAKVGTVTQPVIVNGDNALANQASDPQFFTWLIGAHAVLEAASKLVGLVMPPIPTQLISKSVGNAARKLESQ